MLLEFSTFNQTLAQDFAFGGAGGSNAGFKDSFLLPTPFSGLGTTNANRPFFYLNTTSNIATNRLPNGNDVSFNVVDVGIFDIDSDGFLDLVTVSDDSNSTQINAPQLPSGVLGTATSRVTLFTGLGDGSFGLPVSVSTTAQGSLSSVVGPTCLAIGDLNSDGLGDIVVGLADSSGSGVVQIFSGGTLSTNTISGLVNNVIPLPGASNANSPISIDLERITSDGFLDIIIATNGFSQNFPSQVSIIPNFSGSFLLNSSYTIGGLNPTDGVRLLGNIGTFGDDVAILANRSLASFQSNIALSQTNELVDKDFDIGVVTDKGLEIFESTTSTNLSRPLGFSPAVIDSSGAQSALPTGQMPIGFLPSDINNDNITDLNIINFGSSDITSYLADNTSGYKSATTSKTSLKPTSGALGNFDGDGKIDIATIGFSGGVTLLKGNGDGSFSFDTTSGFIASPSSNPSVVAVGNLEKGSSTDSIVIGDGFNGVTGGVQLLSNKGASIKDYAPLLGRLFTSASLATDFDGKGGLNDIAIIEQSFGEIFLLLNISNSTPPQIFNLIVKDVFTNRKVLPTSATFFTDPLTGLNNLAITTVAASDDGASVGQIIVALNNGNGGFGNSGVFRQFVATSGATSLLSADIRNTGNASDLIYVDYLNNLVATTLNDGTNFFLVPQFRESGGFVPVSLSVADVNDDDNMDVLVLNSGADRNLADNNKRSSVSVLLGQGDGRLIPTGVATPITNFGLSIVGGLAVLDDTQIRRIVDFNLDGFPDFAVSSTRNPTSVSSNQNIPTVSLLLNRPDLPGQFVLQEPITLFDPTTNTGVSNVADSLKGAALSLEDSFGGPALVSGRGGIQNNLTRGFSGAGVGGANNTMVVSDFNADGSPDLAVSGTFRGNQILTGNIINGSLVGSVTPTNYRAVAYLFGNSLTGIVRLSHPIRIREFTGFNGLGNLGGSPTKPTGVGTDAPRTNSGDTFIAGITGNFASAINFVPDMVHLSLNGKIYIDANITSILNHAPVAQISRKDLNAPLGQGRKVFLTSGDIVKIPITVTDIDVDVPRNGFNFILTSSSTGENPPSFVTIATNDDRKSAILTIDTRSNGLGANNTSEPLVKRINVQVNEVGTTPPVTFLFSRDYFTIIVKPRSAPLLGAIPNVNLEVGKTQTFDLQVSEKDGGKVVVTRACDKDSYVSINENRLTIAPTSSDVGNNLCTLTATGPTGLFSKVSFLINVVNKGEIFISSAIFDKTSKQLFISGTGFGSSGAKVTVNGKDVSSRVSKASSTSITLVGARKKLNLKPGENQLVITFNGVTSNTFRFNI
jgi:hypothetical protein